MLRLVESLSQLLGAALPSHVAREVAMFPVVALQEMGVANVSRLEVIWEPITSHLSQVYFGYRVIGIKYSCVRVRVCSLKTLYQKYLFSGLFA